MAGAAPVVGGVAAGTLSVAAGALVPGLAGAALATTDGNNGAGTLPQVQTVRVTIPSGAHFAAPADSDLARLRGCESTDNYGIATGNGFYGAYQFDLGTWRSLGLSGLPQQAQPAVQDAAANALEQSRGWEPWPSCSAQLGLVAHAATGSAATEVLASVVVSGSATASGAAGAGLAVNGAAGSGLAGSGLSAGIAAAASTVVKAAASAGTAVTPASTALTAGTAATSEAGGPAAVGQPRAPRFVTRAPLFGGHVLSIADEPSYRSDVRLWQERMAARGWVIAADGYFGPQTQAVARAFAAEKKLTGGLPGEVGAEVWAAAWTAPIQ